MTPSLFEKFTALDCDRASFILSYLSEHGVKAVTLPVEGHNHIYIKFPMHQYNPQFRMKCVIAHYDRASGTPGANDNSAAVALMLDWAAKLVRFPSFHNVRLILTDGEECGGVQNMNNALPASKEGVMNQGAFSLAAVFRRLGITAEDVYVFDCVGRGTLPVIAKNDAVNAPATFRRALVSLEDRTRLLLHKALQKHLCLPLPYSDNAGFVAQGIAAVCITMLPEAEAEQYLAALMKEEGLSRFVLNRAAANDDDIARYSPLLPATWKLFHTMNDNVQSLSAESIPVMEHILDALGRKLYTL